MTQVFISHSTADKDTARRVAAALGAAGHAVWMDDAALRPGDYIVSAIAGAIENADVVIVLLSKASAVSTAVETEAALAAGRILSGRGGVVIPVLVDRGVELPFALRGFRAVSIGDLGPDLQALVQVVHDAQEGRQASTEVLRLQRDAIEFESRSLETARVQEVVYRWERWRRLSSTLVILSAVVVVTLVGAVLVAQGDATVTALSLTAATAALITALVATYSAALHRREVRRLRDRVRNLEDQLLAERSRQDA